MKVYKVDIVNNAAVRATVTRKLHHGDAGFGKDKHTVKWFAVECEDAKTALDIAGKAVALIWGKCFPA